MAEEATNPVQAEPAQAAAPVQTIPAQTIPVQAAPAEAPRKGSALVVFLTVLLVLVGIADVILWGIAGYYLLLNAADGGGEPAQVVSGEPAQSASDTGTASDDGAKREALEAYIQELMKIADLENELIESHNSVVDENFTDDATLYAEFTGRTLPLCQQMVEKASAIRSDDPEIAELHKIYQDWSKALLERVTTAISAIDNQDEAQRSKSKEKSDEANELISRYTQSFQTLAEERGVPLNLNT